MKKIILLTAIALFLANCASTSIHSNPSSVPKTKKYNNFLVIVLNTKGAWTENSSKKLSQYLAENIRKEGKKAKGMIVIKEMKREKLSFNKKSNADIVASKVKKAISEDNYDILLLLNPVNYTYHRNTLSFVTYDMVAKDLKRNKEVWRAEFITKAGLITPSKKNARIAYESLKKDGLLK